MRDTKKKLVRKNNDRPVVKYALRKCSIGLVSVAVSVCFITDVLATAVYAVDTAIIQEASEAQNTVPIDEGVENNADTIEENVSDKTEAVEKSETVEDLEVQENLEIIEKTETIENMETVKAVDTIALDSDIEAKVNAVKNDLAAVKYEDFFNFLNPYVRYLDRLEIANNLKAELGREPNDDEVQARVEMIYMDKLDLRKSFDSVQQNLESLLKDIFSESSYVDANYVIAYKYELLLGLSYLDRQYSFNFNNNSAKDIILGYSKANKDVLNDLISIGTVTFSDLELQNNVATYNKKIAPITGQADILNFIENCIKIYEPSISAGDWFIRESKAYIYEAQSQYADTSLYNKMKKNDKLKSHLIPLLTLSEDSIYAISTMSTVNYGLIDTYVDRNDSATRINFEIMIKETAKKQEAFLEFWYRISDKKDILLQENIFVIDTMQRYGTGAAKDLWVPKEGSNTISGVREFITPFGFYSSYMFADGQASGTDLINFFLAKSLNDRGQACFTHELTHLLDQKVWFNGYGRRDGKGAEAFATGLFESIDNTLNKSSYKPIFNLNLSYYLGEERVQNASPERFMQESDLKEYMQGLMDVIYTLDYAEAKSSLGRTAEEKTILFNSVELDTSSPNQVKDVFKNIDKDVADSLTSIDDLVEKNIVSGRYTFKGNNTIGTANADDYFVVPLFEPIYAALQNNGGSVGDVTFRRYAYELLGEYGYKDGMAAYVSDKYANDEEALNDILDSKYNGSLAEFKKDMFARRISKLSDLKETPYFTDYEGLQKLMDEAVAKDLAIMVQNKNNNVPITTGVDAVNELKTKIFKWYLTNTNDFETSIYKDKVVVSEDREVTETAIPVSIIYKEDNTLWEDETRKEEGTPGIIKTTSVWRTENGVRVGDPKVTTETIKEMKPAIIYKGTKKIAGEIVTVDENVIIPITVEEVEDPNLYVGEERTVIGEAGIKKVTTIQKTEKDKPVGDPSVTEEIVKEMKPTIIYKGTKPLASQNLPQGVSFVNSTLVCTTNTTDKVSAILDNIVIDENSLVVGKEIIGEIPAFEGDHNITIRLIYRDGTYSDVLMPIKIEAVSTDNNNGNGSGNNSNSNNNNSNNGNSVGSSNSGTPDRIEQNTSNIAATGKNELTNTWTSNDLGITVGSSNIIASTMENEQNNILAENADDDFNTLEDISIEEENDILETESSKYDFRSRDEKKEEKEKSKMALFLISAGSILAAVLFIAFKKFK